MSWARPASFVLAILGCMLGASWLYAGPLDVPPIYAALHARCGDPLQGCCSIGPACDAAGSLCMSDGTCSVPPTREGERCIAPKSGPATVDAGFCDTGLTCDMSGRQPQGVCVACGGIGETCCAAYSFFCDGGLACNADALLCLPAPVAEGQRCDFKTPCASGLTCSNAVAGTCERCGAEFAGCCSSGACNAGLSCTGTVCLSSVLQASSFTCSNGTVLPTSAQCPTASNQDIRVLNYNVQLWPEDFGIDTFLDYVKGHWPQTDKRAKEIGRAVGKETFDIIAFQEAWNPERRAIVAEAVEQQALAANISPHPLIRGGKGVFDVTFGPEQDRLSPYHQIVVNGFALGGATAGAIAGTVLCPIPGINLFCSAALAYLGAKGGGALGASLLTDGELINSGLMVMSRFPIVSTDLHVYEAESGEEAYARKGVVHALVFRGRTPNDFLHVFATHLENGGDVVAKQITELQDFIEFTTLMDDFPILVLGDFNLDGGFAQRGNSGSAYRTLLLPRMTTAKIDPQLTDVWPLLQPNEMVDGTSDGKKRLDYIFASLKVALTARDVKILPFQTTTSVGQQNGATGFPTLSDHLGLSARFTWTPPTITLPINSGTLINVGVAVNRLVAISFDSCNRKMDFYGKATILGASSISNEQPFDRDVTEGNDVHPTAIATLNRFPVGTRTVRAEIDIRDDDDLFCGGGDDVVDINPRPNRSTLDLVINLDHRTVHLADTSGNPIHPPIGVVGGVSRAFGSEGPEAAEVTFRVTVTPAL